MPQESIVNKTWFRWTILISLAYVALNIYAIYSEFFVVMLIPFALAMVLLGFYSLNSFFYLTVFLVPLSIPLNLLTGKLGFNLAIPTEVLLIEMTVIFFLKLLYDGKLDRRVLNHPVSYAIYFYLFWMFITSITSTMPLVSFKFMLAKLWFIVPFYIIGSQIFKDFKNQKRFVFLYASGLIIVIFISTFKLALVGVFDTTYSHLVVRPFFNDHTSYGAVNAFFLLPLIAMVIIYRRQLSPAYLTILIFAVIVFIGLVFSYSRAAWLSIIVSLGVFFLIHFRIRLVFLIVLAGVLAAFFFTYRVEIMYRLEKNDQDSSTNLAEHVESISNISSDASNLERINRWNSAFKMFIDKPVFGYGPGTYQFQYAPFQLARDQTIISTNFGNWGNAHSEYIGPLAESGVLGTMSFLILAITIVITGIRVYYRSRNMEHRVLAMGLLMGLVSYLVHGFLNNFLDTDKISAPFWGFTAMLVVLDIYYRKGSDFVWRDDKQPAKKR